MYPNTLTLYENRPAKSETITVRLSWEQKKGLARLAERKGLSISKFILSLVDEENQRMINDSLYGDLPF